VVEPDNETQFCASAMGAVDANSAMATTDLTMEDRDGRFEGTR
jgi:hypothetical protein